MRVNLTLHQLEAFEKVASHGNFRAAANELHIAQPALSRSVRVLEATLGARLFDRDTRHVALTAVGRELLPIARRILRDFDSAFSDLAQFVDGRRGHVSVAALPSVGAAVLPPILAGWQQERPDAQVALAEALAEPLLQMVDQGEVDFGISVRPPDDSRLRYRHLFDDSFVLVCRRDDPLASLHEVSWKVFANRPYLEASHQGSIGPILEAVFLRQRMTPRAVFRYPSIAAGGAMAAQGLGILALPRMALQLIASDQLATVPLVKPTVNRPIGIITRIGRTLAPVAEELIRRVEAGVSEMGQRAASSRKRSN